MFVVLETRGEYSDTLGKSAWIASQQIAPSIKTFSPFFCAQLFLTFVVSSIGFIADSAEKIVNNYKPRGFCYKGL